MFGKYALIIDDRVDNITYADSEFLDELVSSNQIDTYVLIDFDPEPHIGDSYIDGVFSPYVPPLSIAKAQKIADFQIDVQQYVEDRYPLLTRIQFSNLYVLAKFQGLTARANYIEPLLAWVNSILAYSASFAASVQAQTDAATVVAMTWDITANILSNPGLTIGGAVSLTGTPVVLNAIRSLSTTTTGVSVGDGAASTIGPDVTIDVQTASGSQPGLLSSTDWSSFDAKLEAVDTSVSTPSRTLDSNFTPSSTDFVLVFYTIRIVTALLTPSGSVELRSDTNSTPTTIRARVALTAAITGTQDSVLSYLVPKGHNVRLVSAGTATISIVHQTEVAIQVS